MPSGSHPPPVPPALDLTGRRAIVTGAGSPSGIGFACATALAGLGSSVVVAATSERVHARAAALRDKGFRAAACVGDLTSPATCRALVDLAVETLGGLDILVNNAGMVSSLDGDYLEGGIDATSPDRWEASIARNLDTAYLMCHTAIGHLRASGRGRVVNVASVTGPVMAMRGEVAYAAAKAGLAGLTRALAVDEGRHGVTVNAVAPGWIGTGSQTPAEAAEGRHTPLGRSGTAAEVAAAVAFLASPGAGYVTGQVLVVDGGGSVAEERRPPG